jgi:hypothetical protein
MLSSEEGARGIKEVFKVNATKEYQKDPHLEEAHQHLHEARKALRKSAEVWLPDGYLENKRKARKEVLLAMRSVVEAALAHVDNPDRA